MRKVLVVDDDLILLDLLKMMLSEYYEVITATNGEEAIELYKKHKPDIVLMDILMPKMDGITATKIIKSIDPNAVVLAITAYAPHKGKEMLKAGAVDIIEKPIKKMELVEKIEKFISRKENIVK
ncbi:response regulator receiver protein [Ferroglobus placidus DSM 10642]|uniref:Response regulator receiver protein n=1 Tax=Ferroglobus placidus (strain DSM 10642 / AEDII12DO) TaxID=589924 RepID=D3S1X6_FERPA|nr:response regulator [Ferroglobus placidus]ADC64433.1 response regulator receiver protein [Ferroglobus placidus DSM 10642]